MSEDPFLGLADEDLETILSQEKKERSDTETESNHSEDSVVECHRRQEVDLVSDATSDVSSEISSTESEVEGDDDENIDRALRKTQKKCAEKGSQRTQAKRGTSTSGRAAASRGIPTRILLTLRRRPRKPRQLRRKRLRLRR